MEVKYFGRWWIVILVMLAAAIAFFWPESQRRADLTVLISPYQDLAMLVNIHHLGLEEHFGTTVEIRTIQWEETYTTLLSANSPAHVAFASYADYLTKRESLNRGTDDELLFIYPAYIFRGGAFVSFRSEILPLDREAINDAQRVRDFLAYRIGFPRNTLYEMLIFHLAERAGVPIEPGRFVDVGFDSGFLAARAGDLDIAAVGLTQLTEAARQGGRSVLNMDALGIADITGFIVRRSVLNERREHVQNLIRMWFRSVDFVLADIQNNSRVSLEYLAANAATQYDFESYVAALDQEYFPRSIDEMRDEVLSDDGRYSARQIHGVIRTFLIQSGLDLNVPAEPLLVDVDIRLSE